MYYVLLVSRNELESDTGKGENRKGKRENGDGCGGAVALVVAAA